MGWEAHTTDLGIGDYGKLLGIAGTIGTLIALHKPIFRFINRIVDRFSE